MSDDLPPVRAGPDIGGEQIDDGAWRLPAGSREHWPEDYERGRPGWPPEVVDIAGLASTASVLELGAGTGKLTRLLVPVFRRVVAIEPAEAMRRLLVSLCPDAEALEASAEDIPLADGSVDAVFAAEAFHRFEADRALAEIARVLRPRGVLVLMWNLPAGTTEPSIGAVEQFLEQHGLPSRAEVGYDPLDLNSTRYESGEWRSALAKSPFENLRQARLPHEQTLGREELVAFLASMGWIADFPDADRLPLLEGVRVSSHRCGIPASMGNARLLDAAYRGRPHGRPVTVRSPRGRCRRRARPRFATRSPGESRASGGTSRQGRGSGTRAPAGAPARRPR
jgi:ubiquinone/menaquinone biosynthesis C-methylase UbiE